MYNVIRTHLRHIRQEFSQSRRIKMLLLMHVLHLADVEKLQSVHKRVLKELDHSQNLRGRPLLGVLVQESCHSLPKWYRYQRQNSSDLIVKLVKEVTVQRIFSWRFYFSIFRHSTKSQLSSDTEKEFAELEEARSRGSKFIRGNQRDENSKKDSGSLSGVKYF